VRDIDVKGREIGVFKILINKGFPDIAFFLGNFVERLMSENPYFYSLSKHINRPESDRVELTD
jgi:hypothetical protein